MPKQCKEFGRYAFSVLRSQQCCPDSPGRLDDSAGRASLCLGALLAKAGTRVRFGAAAAEEFVAALFVGDGKQAIRDQFVKLGWGVDAADVKIAKNDSTPEIDRRKMFAEEIASFNC